MMAQLRSAPKFRFYLCVFSIALSLPGFGVPVVTSWTYQGHLRRSGTAYTGTCNFQFSLWDAASAGTQRGTTQAINGVNVVNGLFTVVLDFGDFLFTGEARWLGTNVQCSGDGGFTPLDPRQSLTATPYALGLKPGARIEGSVNPLNAMLTLGNTALGGIALNATSHIGVQGTTNTTDGFGVYGFAVSGPGGAGVFGRNVNGPAVFGLSVGTGTALVGENTGTGLAGKFVGRVNVAGENPVGATLSVSNSNTGLFGYGIEATGSTGLYATATTTNGSGVVGVADGTNSAGVFGLNRLSAAIWGRSTGTGSAVFGENTSVGYAGRFIGPVHVQGNLTKSSGAFQIDHPLDPANKFLSHSFVESPDMMNIYNGNVVTDASGSATVILPDYFAALNRDPRYQLTVLGQFAQAIVARKIAGNSFEIRTDKPGVEVSWQVTGIRQDAYAKAHPIVVEEFKPVEQKGLYLYPAGFGAGEEKRIGQPSRPPGATAAGSNDQARSQ